jgi:sporulation protein YlmC with PRC-barrel domain
MKTRILVSTAIGLFGTAAVLLSTSNAQQEATRQSDVARERQQVDRAGNVSVGVLDEETTGALVRASQLMGTDIENSRGDNVGEIEDLVLDGNSGQIRYVAVTYGGFLGVGDKMFAVPFEAFRVRQQEDDADEFVLTLDVTQQQLDGAQGFDQENWPNFADRNFTRELDRRYGIDRSPRQARNPNQNTTNGTRNGLNDRGDVNQNDVDNRNDLNRNNGDELNRQ